MADQALGEPPWDSALERAAGKANPFPGGQLWPWPSMQLSWDRAAIVGILAVVVAAALARLGGLGVDSLWFDDLWVAVLAKAGSLSEVLRTPAPVAPGFLLLLRAGVALFGEKDWVLQLLPFCFGLAAILLTGLAVRAVTGDAMLAVVGAAVMALNPVAAHYSVFVKQYTMEAALTAVLLLLAVRALERPRPEKRAHLVAAAFGVLALGFSLPSVFFGVLLVNLVPVLASREAPAEERRQLWAITLAFDLAAAVVLLLLKARVTPALQAYWSRHLLPVGATWSYDFRFIRKHALEGAAAALPEGWPRGVLLLLPLGLFQLGTLGRSKARVAAFFALSYLSMVAAWLLRLYPIGGGRTDIFSFPATIALGCAGLQLLLRPFGERARRAATATFAVPALALALIRPPIPHYFVLDDGRLIRELHDSIAEGDGLLIYPWASFVVGRYGGWPFAIVTSQAWENGFEVHLDRPGTLTIPRAGQLEAKTAVDEFLDRRFERVFFVAHRVNRSVPQELIFDSLRTRGYALRKTIASRKVSVSMFEGSRSAVVNALDP